MNVHDVLEVAPLLLPFIMFFMLKLSRRNDDNFLSFSSFTSVDREGLSPSESGVLLLRQECSGLKRLGMLNLLSPPLLMSALFDPPRKLRAEGLLDFLPDDVGSGGLELVPRGDGESLGGVSDVFLGCRIPDNEDLLLWSPLRFLESHFFSAVLSFDFTFSFSRLESLLPPKYNEALFTIGPSSLLPFLPDLSDDPLFHDDFRSPLSDFPSSIFVRSPVPHKPTRLDPGESSTFWLSSKL